MNTGEYDKQATQPKIHGQPDLFAKKSHILLNTCRQPFRVSRSRVIRSIFLQNDSESIGTKTTESFLNIFMHRPRSSLGVRLMLGDLIHIGRLTIAIAKMRRSKGVRRFLFWLHFSRLDFASMMSAPLATGCSKGGWYYNYLFGKKRHGCELGMVYDLMLMVVPAEHLCLPNL